MQNMVFFVARLARTMKDEQYERKSFFSPQETVQDVTVSKLQKTHYSILVVNVIGNYYRLSLFLTMRLHLQCTAAMA